jgi:hypothetical protein
MVGKRQVTGETQGDVLAQLLNLSVRDRRRAELQKELRSLFTALPRLLSRLSTVEPGSEHPGELKCLLKEINGFLETYPVYPQVLIVSHVFRKDLDAVRVVLPPQLVQEFAPMWPDGDRRNAVMAICSLVRYGLLDRVRQCLRCEKWFFAVKSDSKYCSRTCQTRPTEQYRAIKREYAKRRYREEKERAARAKITVRGGRK